jgi:GNAT superfamily N-acetyltransferase
MKIDIYRPEHAARFAELNLGWLEEFGLLEPADEAQLADPVKHFIAPGGQIFVALDDAGRVVGVCAVVPHGDQGECEVAKLAVDPDARGQGIARRLVECCLTWARAMGFRRVILVSNHQLLPARALYETVGFVYAPVPPEFTQEYETADIYMTLDLGALHSAEAH